jgi:hypothetical protein
MKVWDKRYLLAGALGTTIVAVLTGLSATASLASTSPTPSPVGATVACSTAIAPAPMPGHVETHFAPGLLAPFGVAFGPDADARKGIGEASRARRPRAAVAPPSDGADCDGSHGSNVRALTQPPRFLFGFSSASVDGGPFGPTTEICRATGRCLSGEPTRLGHAGYV